MLNDSKKENDKEHKEKINKFNNQFGKIMVYEFICDNDVILSQHTVNTSPNMAPDASLLFLFPPFSSPSFSAAVKLPQSPAAQAVNDTRSLIN